MRYGFSVDRIGSIVSSWASAYSVLMIQRV